MTLLLAIVLLVFGLVLEKLWHRIRRLEGAVRELDAELASLSRRGPLALLLLVLGLAGCLGPLDLPYSDPTPRPGQAEAIQVVWTQTYGRTDAPPQIRFVVGNDLDQRCNRQGWYNAFVDACVAGQRVGNDLYLAWPPGMSWGRSALAHEAFHYLLGDDSFHLDPGWAPGGIVDQCQAALVAAGL